MKSEYISPFINAVLNAFKMMAGVTPVQQKPFIKETKSTSDDVTGMRLVSLM